MPLCKLCKTEAKLVEAHIIPRAFYQLSDTDEPVKIVSSVEGEHPRRMRIGIYDPNILCAKCDGALGLLDQHAAETLLPPGTPISSLAGGPALCQYDRADPVLIHHFVASVYWRASVSSHSFFRRVRLGPYEDRIADLLNDPAKQHGSEIETVLGEFNSDRVPILDPCPNKWGAVRVWTLYANRFVLYFKTDQRPSPDDMSQHVLRKGAPVRTWVRDWLSSKERAAMVPLARRHPNLYKPRSRDER